MANTIVNGSLLDERRKIRERKGMQPQLRFVHEDDRRPERFRLEQQRRQRDEPKRTVRKGRGVKICLRSSMFPLQANLVLGRRLKHEIVEKRRHQTDDTLNKAIRFLVRLTQKIQKRRQIGAVGAQIEIVVYIDRLLHWRRRAGVVKMVAAPTTQMFPNVLRDPLVIGIADTRFAVPPRKPVLIRAGMFLVPEVREFLRRKEPVAVIRRQIDCILLHLIVE